MHKYRKYFVLILNMYVHFNLNSNNLIILKKMFIIILDEVEKNVTIFPLSIASKD